MFPKFEKSNYFTTILRFQVFISGAAVMVLEVLGSRVLSPYFGNTLFVWGSLIGVVLTGLSLGYTYGGKNEKNVELFTVCSLKSICTNGSRSKKSSFGSSVVRVSGELLLVLLTFLHAKSSTVPALFMPYFGHDIDLIALKTCVYTF